MSAHTPGPWTAHRNSWGRWEIHYAGGQLAGIAKSDDPASPPPVSETEANARLIAAAPELFYCLMQIMQDLPIKRDWLNPDLERAALDALAKALGEE